MPIFFHKNTTTIKESFAGCCNKPVISGKLSLCESVRIRSFSGPYLSVFSPNTGKYGPENLPIQILFTQC